MRLNSSPSLNDSLISSRQILLEPLDGRVVASRLVADRDRHAGEIGRTSVRRIRRHEDAARGNRIALGVELAVALRGGDVHGPVAGAADVCRRGRLPASGRRRPCCRADEPLPPVEPIVAELVVETLGGEIPFSSATHSCSRKCGATTNFVMGVPLAFPLGVSSWRFLLAFPLGSVCGHRYPLPSDARATTQRPRRRSCRAETPDRTPCR